MNATERDALLSLIRLGHWGDVLRALVKALPLEEGRGVPVEETERVIDLGREPRTPADVFRNPPSFAAEAQPDFAAMAKRYQNSWSGSLADFLASEWPKPPPAAVGRSNGWWKDRAEECRFNSEEQAELWLRKTFAALVATPAPVERDNAWWTRLVIECLDTYHYAPAGPSDVPAERPDVMAVVKILRSTFAAPVAFDVEAFIASVKRDLGNSTHWAADSIRMVGETMRAVAKQMGAR